MLPSFLIDAAIISKGGRVILPCSLISLPRSAPQAGSMGRSSGHSFSQRSHVVHRRNFVTHSWVIFSLPSKTSRRKYHLPRGELDSQPCPLYWVHPSTQ